MSLDGGRSAHRIEGEAMSQARTGMFWPQKGQINCCLTTSRGRSVLPDTKCCFRDPVLGWGMQEGRGLLHIRKSWNNPEESPQLRERGAKLGERAFTDGSWDDPTCWPACPLLLGGWLLCQHARQPGPRHCRHQYKAFARVRRGRNAPSQ
jgi:hypothetical protein